MRHFLILLIGVLSMPATLYAAEPLGTAQLTARLAQAGAMQLALARVEREQPAVTDRLRWLEWEQLHIALLDALGRHEALLKRVELLPADASPSLQQSAYAFAANAALQLKQIELSRDYLRRQIWGAEMSAAELKRARYQLIETCIDEKPAVAYQAMLKFQQDYATPDHAQLRRLLKALLFSGMEKEAATWLPQLAATDSLKLWIQLQLGTIPPEAAMTAAQLALREGGQQDNWLVIMQAAAAINHSSVRLGAQEQLLNAPVLSAAELRKVNPAILWQDYVAYAQMLGNQNHLLSGDDAAWVSQATQWSTTAPLDARAFWVYLAEYATEPSVRERAQAELYLSLLDAGMGTTVVRLVQKQARNPQQAEQIFKHLEALENDLQQQVMLLAQARYAETQGNYLLAADFALQGAVLHDGAPPDLALQMYASAVDNLGRAGLVEDAVAVQERLVRLKLIRNVPPAPLL